MQLVTKAKSEFGEITQNNGHYAVQCHSKSLTLVQIENLYGTPLVINTNLPPILHCFQVKADYMSDFR